MGAGTPALTGRVVLHANVMECGSLEKNATVDQRFFSRDSHTSAAPCCCHQLMTDADVVADEWDQRCQPDSAAEVKVSTQKRTPQS